MEEGEGVEDVPQVPIAQVGQHRAETDQQHLQPGALTLGDFYNKSFKPSTINQSNSINYISSAGSLKFIQRKLNFFLSVIVGPNLAPGKRRELCKRSIAFDG